MLLRCHLPPRAARTCRLFNSRAMAPKETKPPFEARELSRLEPWYGASAARLAASSLLSRRFPTRSSPGERASVYQWLNAIFHLGAPVSPFGSTFLPTPGALRSLSPSAYERSGQEHGREKSATRWQPPPPPPPGAPPREPRKRRPAQAAYKPGRAFNLPVHPRSGRAQQRYHITAGRSWHVTS